MSHTSLKNLVLSALFAAIVFIATANPLRIDLGPSGYIHLGDAFIYLTASFISLPFAMIAAAIGGSLADLLTGYAIWAPFTFVIKVLLTLSFTNKKPKILCTRNLIACAIALPITTFGYYLAESIIVGSFIASIGSLIPNFIQAAISAVLYFAVAVTLDKANVKEKLSL